MKAVTFLLLLLVSEGCFAQSEKSNSYFSRSRELLEQKKFKEAEQYADSALTLVRGTGRMDSIANAYLWLLQVHTEKKDFEAALQDFKTATLYQDSAEWARRNAAEKDSLVIQAAEKQLNKKKIDERDTTITQLRTTAEENWRNTLILLGGMLVLALVIVLALFRKKGHLQRSLAQSQLELRQMQSFKEKLFTVLSYDLKNSLSAFENLAQGMGKQTKALNKEQTAEFLSHLHTTAIELKNTLGNVIHWVGYQANAKPISPELFDCKLLAEEVIKQFEEQRASRNLTVSIFMPGGQFVFADREMVAIILANLLSNAVQFTQTGGVITCFSGRKDGLVTLGVKDTGVGISETDIQKLFKVAEDFHSIGPSGHKGAGVGLVLSKELVERNGGRMYVESAVGQGSTFYFTLPEKKFE